MVDFRDGDYYIQGRERLRETRQEHLEKQTITKPSSPQPKLACYFPEIFSSQIPIFQPSNRLLLASRLILSMSSSQPMEVSACLDG